jgi:hypothetical protein
MSQVILLWHFISLFVFYVLKLVQEGDILDLDKLEVVQLQRDETKAALDDLDLIVTRYLNVAEERVFIRKERLIDDGWQMQTLRIEPNFFL